MPSRAALANLFAVIVAAVAWSGLLLQYWLILWSGPALWATVRFLSFFTILSNLLVALVAGSAATGGNWRFLRLWRSPRIRGLAALSITVTCLVYATVLQGQWHPQGPQLIADRAVHYVVPALYVFWWLALLPHGELRWSDALRWLVFPGLFAAWTFLRGAVVHEYPYLFMNVDHLGYGQVLLNTGIVGGLFLILGLIYVAIDRRLA
ncbi:Pr6Pr family membrane protein [Luteibacter aegosomaticola]|uniref:Pr6Pr family membrane protein n=1 Tax=Luteibacter aegosomaticola TaxID=2911538 RepID=UPI001FFBD744|nr:Pr6Pr family membrane protein [Luteibacter aegosomaticola]UPG91882.1 Pr6Pr family membrane protein [Luteibacter aegosomaticola]